jgi:hypothetical protein
MFDVDAKGTPLDEGFETDGTWTKINREDESTWPDDGQEVYYVFTATGNPMMWEGKFYRCKQNGHPLGSFVGKGGFCDWYDAEYWRART